MNKLKIGDTVCYSKKYIESMMINFRKSIPKLPRKKKKKLINGHLETIKRVRYKIVNIEKHK